MSEQPHVTARRARVVRGSGSEEDLAAPMEIWRPGVFIIGPVAAGALAEIAHPRSIGLGYKAVFGSGTILIIFAVALAARTFIEFYRYQTPFRVDRHAKVLMVGGPFRYSRNPLYLAACLGCAGAGLVTDSLWLLGTASLLPLSITIGMIRAEERFLTRKFGSAYSDYVAKVRRWI